jgi:methionine synthase II (cobalamin-independent)
VPDDQAVVLGLISSKTSAIEPAEDVESRVREAAKYAGLERLGLSAQCGFSSVSVGVNHISEETQQRKLKLVGQVARQIWVWRLRPNCRGCG